MNNLMLFTSFLLCSMSAAAQDLPRVAPEQAGFSTERLTRIEERYAAGVAAKEIPGAVVLVMRNGQVVYEKSVGFSDRTTGTPMKADTVFWLASMTKPITSVAVMMLVEEGKIDLNAPAALYLPELAGLKLGVERADGTLELREPARQPTVQDLLRHTAGMVYGQFGNTAVHRAYLAAEVIVPTISSAEMIKRLAKLPLAHEPGQVFEYSIATDVLGRIVEVVAKEPLDKFIERRIAKPLGMSTLGFYVPEGKTFAWADVVPARSVVEQAIRRTPPLLSGGGGLYGTASDYARFAQMLLNGGELNGVRLLSSASVALMASNHLPDGIAFPPEIISMLSVIAPTPERGQGFGLGFAVRTDPGLHTAPGSVGDFYWAGAGGTYFWVDPAEKLVAVALTAQPEYEMKVRYRQLARNLVYQALVTSFKNAPEPSTRIVNSIRGTDSSLSAPSPKKGSILP